MMGTTPNYALPYPDPASTVDVPRDVKALAERTDELLRNLIDPPLCILEQSVSQSIPNQVLTSITMDLEIVDTAGMHAASPNPSRVVAPVAGWYLVTGCVTYVLNTTGRRSASFAVNGALPPYTTGNAVTPLTGASTFAPAQTVHLFMNAGDYVEIRGYQSVGTPLATEVSAGNRSTIQVRFICP